MADPFAGPPPQSVGVDPEREQPVKLGALLVQDPERDVARAGQLAGLRQDSPQHRLRVQLLHQRATDIQQPAQDVSLAADRRWPPAGRRVSDAEMHAEDYGRRGANIRL